MTNKELLEIIKRLGWKNINRDGDMISILYLQDRVIKLLPYIKKRASSDLYFDLGASLGREDFSRATMHIRKRRERNPFSYILQHDENISVLFVEEITESFVVNEINDVIDWAKAQDLQPGIDEYAALPTGSLGIYPLYHLAALAVNKDQVTLLNYLNHFKAGDRLDFVPYITQEYIERAYEIACK
ncbi:hypothetical protein B9T31_13545 [Acinetobacter sp. ANC 4558]|uniref:DUF6990 domain-containing protein n=1 Tax=Acinetobacter sp. ANC 4558 TaxID=1977876 RepID=UPI000A332870|nr:hypothetical protein [Acinetobacter sp. ANC 4558]OTG84176.1 hypothetical protein B9T31_13545 [Acinetobacter sp. ANC 4558]